MPPNDPTGLYPAPPTNALGNLGLPQLLGVVDKSNKIQQFNVEFGAQNALGRAVTQNPGDAGAAMRQFANDPASAWGPTALPGMEHLQSLQDAQAEYAKKQFQFGTDFVGSLASDPNMTPKKLIGYATIAARNYSAIPGQTILDLINSPDDLQTKSQTLQRIVIGAAALAHRADGPPTAGGATSTVPLSAAMPGGAATVPGGIPGQVATGLAPGESSLISDPATRAAKLQATSSMTAQYHADLDNLKQESSVLGQIGGPTVPFEKKANEVPSRFGLQGLGTMTPDQLRSVEGFDKIVNNISRVQGEAFGGTDAARSMSLGSNPSTSMSAYGREGLIDMTQGNQDAVDKARQIWLDARRRGAPAGSYDDFMDSLTRGLDPENKPNEVLDPRVFQFNRLSRENQQKFLSQVDPADLPDFEQRYQYAIDGKWVKPLKKVAPNAANQ